MANDVVGRGTGAHAPVEGALGTPGAASLELQIYAAVTNSITDMVSVLDEHEVYRFVNDAWCRSTGRAREDVIGRTAYELLPHIVTEPRRRALHECFDQQRRVQLRDRVASRSGGFKHLETTYYPLSMPLAGLRCAVLVTRDITDEALARADRDESSEHLRRTLNATGDAIFASDAARPDEPVRFVNDRMLQMWGIPPQLGPMLTPAQIMRYAEPLFVDEGAERRRIAEIIAGNLRAEDLITLRDGRVLLRRCTPATDGPGTLRVWSFRDVTSEQRAMQAVLASEAEQRALLDAFPGYIAGVDQDFRYTYVNDRLARDVLEREPAEIVGRPLREIIGDERFAVVRGEVARARVAGPVTTERRFPATARRPRLDLQLTHVAGPHRADGSWTCYVFGVDITRRNLADEALIAAKDEAERANRAKSRFMSQMSHELRTPLNAILGFGQLLHTDERDPLTAEQRRYVDEILRGGRHLLELINELLDLGRVETGRFVFDRSTVPLAELADECIALMLPLARESDVGVFGLPPEASHHRVVADRTRLKQVLLNLIGNAIKYNRPGGEVRLSAGNCTDTVELSVHDTGDGLTPEQHSRLFVAFERLGADARAIEGTGIGLALSRRIVQAMHGEIGVDSTPGRGSRFWVRLPRVPDDAPATDATVTRPAAPPGATATRPARVLYIEDNAVNTLLMRAMIERLPGVDLTETADPLDGLAQAREQLPDMVLLDLQLPHIDGFEVLRRLRADPRTAAIPVVAVSASAMPSDVRAGLAAGFDDYLTKPLQLDALVAAVHNALAPSAR